jgi:hypothetical protein
MAPTGLRRSLAPLGKVCFAAVLAFQASCGGAPAVSPGIEDKARRDVPIAICRTQLAVNDTTETGMPRPELYWKTLFPRFRGFGSVMDLRTQDCIGEPILVMPGVAPSAPNGVSKDDLTIAAADDGIQAVWLRASTSDPAAFGPLALVRPRPALLDVYAIGLYRGSARHSRFEFIKLGATAVLVARDEACGDVKPGADCESTMSFYVASAGRLNLGGKTPLQATQRGTMKDVGKIQTRLTTDPFVLEGETLKIKEKISVRDQGDDEVRRSEGERVFTLKGNELLANKDSIWTQH